MLSGESLTVCLLLASALLNDIVLGKAGVGMILLKLQLLQSSLGW